ncbi:MAG: Mur ligase family protein [Mycoplasma sp.]|nr:Mur ligase family protein [Mycoplasma sp.]
MQWETLFNLKGKRKNNNKIKNILIKIFDFKKTFKIFNIVGTNGKGSVSTILSNSFNKVGYKVGLFTSPHIFKPNERIKINGVEINDDEFEKIYLKIKDLNLSFFSIFYIVSLVYFRNNNIDIAFIEAGIGGNLDTTNTIDGDWGVVTSIGIDHTEYLGDTKEKIAIDKSRIINKNMKFYIPTSIKEFGKYFEKEDFKYIDNIDKNYVLENQNLAKLIVKDILGIEINNFTLPFGRNTILFKNNYKRIINVGHNYDGIKAAIDFLSQTNEHYDSVLISLNKSKYNPKIESLFINKDVYYYKVNDDFYDFNSFKKIYKLKEFYNEHNKDLLIIGSFYLVGELWK